LSALVALEQAPRGAGEFAVNVVTGFIFGLRNPEGLNIWKQLVKIEKRRRFMESVDVRRKMGSDEAYYIEA